MKEATAVFAICWGLFNSPVEMYYFQGMAGLTRERNLKGIVLGQSFWKGSLRFDPIRLNGKGKDPLAFKKGWATMAH